MTVIARWWCCAEYARTGAQHDEACEYALLGDRADVLVQVKADYARLAHQHRGAVAALREIAEAGDHTDEWEAIDRAKEFLARLATTGRAVDHEC